MKRNLILLAAPLWMLAACNSQPSQPEVVDDNPDPMATQLANRPAVELPPSIRSDRTYRCGDGSVIGVAFFDGGKLANVRIPNDAAPVRLTAPEAGQPFVADGGWKLAGDDKAFTVTTNEGKSLTCHS